MAFIGFTRNIYFVTTTVADWVDIFTRPQYKQIVVESLDYCQKNKGLVFIQLCSRLRGAERIT